MNALRRALWTLGTPVRVALIGGIRLYRITLSGWLGAQCRFYPTCSHYGEDAIRQRGAVRGSVMTAWRIMRCNPFGAGGIDPVRTDAGRVDAESAYDDILRTTPTNPRSGEEART